MKDQETTSVPPLSPERRATIDSFLSDAQQVLPAEGVELLRSLYNQELPEELQSAVDAIIEVNQALPLSYLLHREDLIPEYFRAVGYSALVAAYRYDNMLTEERRQNEEI